MMDCVIDGEACCMRERMEEAFLLLLLASF